ncbi:MAG: STAS/SEC14 domain-containing protein [bacterium]|nr:STAS/SEC14 domain-containing protein [Gammaproteobacteria bacterium]
MLSVEIDRQNCIAIFQPQGPMSQPDFDAAEKIIDPYIEEHGSLRGLIIRTKVFPGWESFGGLVSHIKFVKNHHKVLTHVAIVTDSKLGDLAETIGGHFVSAEVKHFPFERLDSATKWMLDG